MNPDTIVLIHGFWVTPRSWEHWKTHYEQQGYRVLTPAYPGFEVEVEALNADPTPIEDLTVPAVIDHLTDVIGRLERPPILMGHSAGGVFTQLMLDRGHGAVGVAINSAPTEGVPVVPLSQLKSTFPVLRMVGRKKAAGVTLEQWRYAFTNTFTEEESRALYQRYHTAATGHSPHPPPCQPSAGAIAAPSTNATTPTISRTLTMRMLSIMNTMPSQTVSAVRHRDGGGRSALSHRDSPTKSTQLR
jgi:pimeloyl-ACP methyl ester carboxylesterase